MINQIKEHLIAAGLGHRVDRILSLLRPSVRLATQRAAEKRFAIGSSRIGGLPDVRPDWEWPSWRGKHLAFLAQINLADLQRFEFCDCLPHEGILQFFYDGDQRMWGFDPQDLGSWFVCYQPTISLIKPAAEPAMFPACEVYATGSMTLPPWESQAFEDLRLTPEERDRYFEVLDKLEEEYPSKGPQHQVLGNPLAIQGDMQLECQLVSNGRIAELHPDTGIPGLVHCGQDHNNGSCCFNWIQMTQPK
jgi:hypothetical protein